ncbi:hypothetical protein GCM10009565_33930 [Amycolatopsis albidoflavus]
MSGTVKHLWALDAPTIATDCGLFQLGTGGAPLAVPIPTFLIEHDLGLLMFDSGLDSDAAGDPARAYGPLAEAFDIRFPEDHRLDTQLGEGQRARLRPGSRRVRRVRRDQQHRHSLGPALARPLSTPDRRDRRHPMRAAVMVEVGKPLEIREIELDEPMPREVVVRVKASGLCHSDLHTMNTDFEWPLPLVLGHEVAGVVESTGADVTGVKAGDHVVANLISSCGACADCVLGVPTNCANPGAIRRGPNERPRYSLDGKTVTQIGDIGGFAEKILVHERNLVPVDKALPFDRAALLGCGVITGIGAVKNAAQVKFGNTVAVIGCGGVGLNVVQGAAISGASHVIAIDLQPASSNTPAHSAPPRSSIRPKRPISPPASGKSSARAVSTTPSRSSGCRRPFGRRPTSPAAAVRPTSSAR